jgi:hypothetical protein
VLVRVSVFMVGLSGLGRRDFISVGFFRPLSRTRERVGVRVVV